jgi:hypothetical protein
MNGDHYIPDAHTPEEHANNCQFQLINVVGWLGLGDREAARIKATCLLRSAEALVAELEALARAVNNPASAPSAPLRLCVESPKKI